MLGGEAFGGGRQGGRFEGEGATPGFAPAEGTSPPPPPRPPPPPPPPPPPLDPPVQPHTCTPHCGLPPPRHSLSPRRPPLPTQGRMAIHTVACLLDNYCYLIVDTTPTSAPYPCAAVDPSEPDLVAAALETIGAAQYGGPDALRLECILSTHKHWDHTAGNKKLLKIVDSCTRVYGGKADEVPGCTLGGGIGGERLPRTMTSSMRPDTITSAIRRHWPSHRPRIPANPPPPTSPPRHHPRYPSAGGRRHRARGQHQYQVPRGAGTHDGLRVIPDQSSIARCAIHRGHSILRRLWRPVRGIPPDDADGFPAHLGGVGRVDDAVSRPRVRRRTGPTVRGEWGGGLDHRQPRRRPATDHDQHREA